MCFASTPKPPPPPAPPPPPPPVLEQSAANTAMGSQSDKLKSGTDGTKKYRTSLGIASDSSGSSTGGLGIPT